MSNFKLETYKLDKDQDKLAYIFSNNKYPNGHIRKGDNVDVKELEKILPKLGFEVEIHENLKQTKCLVKLEEIANNHEKKASVILVIFLSHGSLNEIKMTDEKTITIKQIAESFNTKGNAFAGKPKIFLFQMCQGDQSAKSIICDEEKDANPITTNQNVDEEIIVEEVEDSKSSVPTGSDMFMGFSSSPGFASYRSPIYGSRYIQTFTTIISDEINSRSRTEKIDFISLMTKVAAEVAHMRGKSWPSCSSVKAVFKLVPRTKRKVKMQMPWYSSTLTKKLEFEIPPET